MYGSAKVYVAVNARFEPDGKVYHMTVTWEDGREYQVDRVLDIRRAASLRAGGRGLRYKVRIGRRETFLFLEGDKWFVERKATGMQARRS